MSYVSDAFGGNQGEGQITAVRLMIPTDGDFDFDEDVDGFDLLAWQQRESPNALSANDLNAWRTNYGGGALAEGRSTALPEPATGMMLIMGAVYLLSRRVRSDGICRFLGFSEGARV